MILILLFTILVIFLFHELYWKRRNYPPGPIPIPFIGNLLSLNKPAPGYEAFRRWNKVYGDVYTFWIASTPYIIISSYERVKETFIRDADTYANKVTQDFQEKVRGGSFGIIETNGPLWRDHRRFALTNLRDFGLGKDLMQEKILIEVEDIFKKFDLELDGEAQITEKFDNGVANVINQLLFGYRFDGEKAEEFKTLKQLIDYQTDNFSSIKIIVLMFVPWLKFLVPRPNLDDVIDTFKEKFYTFFNRQIEEHRKNIDFEGMENTDFVEAYLKEQKRRQDDGDLESFSTIQLSNVCLDLWFAGLTTTTTTISWALAYAVNYPEVLKKIHEELDRVIGSDRLITTSDKNDLVYMSAFINESQRCANIVPLNLTHETTRDTVINGHHIKKGTGVIAQISTIMLDEIVFENPEKFQPERFLESDSGKLKKIEELIPFSIGKRQCLGEGLARMELFLFISNFLNRYEVKPSNDGVPSLDKSNGIGVTHRVFSANLKKRYS